jgi:hypothetical protein
MENDGNTMENHGKSWENHVTFMGVWDGTWDLGHLKGTFMGCLWNNSGKIMGHLWEMFRWKAWKCMGKPLTLIRNVWNIYGKCEFWRRQTTSMPCQVNHSLRALRCLWFNLAKGPLSLPQHENNCGTLGACTCFPRKDIQLRVWFVCWFDFPQLFILVGGA